jgi:CBS domain-containing protein
MASVVSGHWRIMNERGTQFLAAFNEIEDCFRATLAADEHVDFAALTRAYAERKRLPFRQRDALIAFASLRNAISHGRYFGGLPIAEPVQEVVDQIEQLRDQIKSPPRALAVLGVMNVFAVRPDEPISAALDHVRSFDYSQLPVYGELGYSAILTTNAIARWLAHQLSINVGLAEDEPVSRVLEFAEPHERALLLRRNISVAEAIDRLAHGGPAGTAVTALIITDNGKNTEKPLAVVVADDLPALTAALEFT